MNNKVNKILTFFEKNYKISQTRENPFRVLISCILSQRTRDENEQKASSKLFSVVKTPKQLADLPLKRIEKLVYSSGYYKQKAKRIKQVSKIIHEKYKDKVPKTREELIKLYGVGYKTADITMMYGHGIPSVAVDTHCNRIPKRIGLVPEDASLEEVKQTLEKIFPRNKWYLVNTGFVRFGQTICLPRNPHCSVCQFNKFCRYYKRNCNMDTIVTIF